MEYNTMIRQGFSPLRRLPLASTIAALCLASLPAAPALAIDWSGVPAKTVVLTYPGQASWEWVLTKSDHEGAEKFRGGKACRECHDDETLAEDGAELAKGGKLEPAPVPGMAGSLPVKVQFAHDGSALSVRLQWKATGNDAKQDANYAAHAALILADPANKEANRAGCWAACHDDSEGMASAGAAPQEKYIGTSRVKLSRQGGGAAVKPAADLQALLAGGNYFEYWTAKLKADGSATAEGGYILDKFHASAASKLSSTASFANGEWTVVLTRPLASAGPGEVALAAGKVYPVGFAIHDGHTKGRYHFVSMEHKLTLDSGSADFVATKK
jgi:cytochrome c-type protein NapC